MIVVVYISIFEFLDNVGIRSMPADFFCQQLQLMKWMRSGVCYSVLKRVPASARVPNFKHYEATMALCCSLLERNGIYVHMYVIDCNCMYICIYTVHTYNMLQSSSC